MNIAKGITTFRDKYCVCTKRKKQQNNKKHKINIKIPCQSWLSKFNPGHLIPKANALHLDLRVN